MFAKNYITDQLRYLTKESVVCWICSKGISTIFVATEYARRKVPVGSWGICYQMHDGLSGIPWWTLHHALCGAMLKSMFCKSYLIFRPKGIVTWSRQNISWRTLTTRFGASRLSSTSTTHCPAASPLRVAPPNSRLTVWPTAAPASCLMTKTGKNCCSSGIAL